MKADDLEENILTKQWKRDQQRCLGEKRKVFNVMVSTQFHDLSMISEAVNKDFCDRKSTKNKRMLKRNNRRKNYLRSKERKWYKRLSFHTRHLPVAAFDWKRSSSSSSLSSRLPSSPAVVAEEPEVMSWDGRCGVNAGKSLSKAYVPCIFQ